MSVEKPMPLLLIEDDEAECEKFKNRADERADVAFVGMTASSFEGMQYVKTRLPEGVILDLELNMGQGSGLQFLAELNKSELTLRPFVVVTTNSPSGIVYDHAHANGADFIFYKKKSDYSPDLVIEHMLAIRMALNPARSGSGDTLPIESPEEFRGRVAKRIDAEMDLIGISSNYRGRAYLCEAISALVEKKEGESESVINQVAVNNKVNYSAVIRAIQTSINSAWKSSSLDDLRVHYSARINIRTGVPSPTEFIHYYADKIRRTI